MAKVLEQSLQLRLSMVEEEEVVVEKDGNVQPLSLSLLLSKRALPSIIGWFRVCEK